MAIAAAFACADDVQMKFVASGATAKAGGYAPIRSEFKGAAPAELKKAPAGLKNPMYGSLTFGKKSVGYIIDDTDPSKIFVDSNGDGDYTNDPAAEWAATKRGQMTMYMGGATVDAGLGTPVKVNFYRFDPTDASRAALKSTLLYYGDFGYEVTLNLGGKSYTSFIAGSPSERSSLSVDRDGNGKTSFFHERISVGKPFNFTGTTYVLNLRDNKLALDKAAQQLPLDPMPPVLEAGAKVPTFTATTMDGTKVEFPKTYKGKIVMLDFWATWCGPCMGEVPNLVKNYDQFHSQGFEVLGISFDQENAVDKIKSTTGEKGMTWQQVYEGKFWDTTLGHQFDVAAIPFAVLVDGDTGEILAVSGLRGPELATTIQKALAKKKGAGSGSGR
jgi:thiol-disulfide isomerase/thioredoxin